MARPDRTAIGNEGTYGSDVMTNVIGPDGITSKSNELAAALLNGYVLTDDAYGTSGHGGERARAVRSDVALGRLVETPGHGRRDHLVPRPCQQRHTRSEQRELGDGYRLRLHDGRCPASRLEPEANGRASTTRSSATRGRPRTSATSCSAARRPHRQPQHPLRPVAPAALRRRPTAEPARSVQRVGADRSRTKATWRGGCCSAWGATPACRYPTSRSAAPPTGRKPSPAQPGRRVRRQHGLRPR